MFQGSNDRSGTGKCGYAELTKSFDSRIRLVCVSELCRNQNRLRELLRQFDCTLCVLRVLTLVKAHDSIDSVVWMKRSFPHESGLVALDAETEKNHRINLLRREQ
jgi:hypothetical protein